MRILYLDCFSGISGDMTLAALADAGADREYIESELQKIGIEPFSLQWRTVMKNGISALKVDVLIPEGHEPSRHRHFSEIAEWIRRAGFNEKVQAWSLAIFTKIGEAEAKIHNIPLDRVHFHEVGAIDSIADIVGVALALDSLKIDRIVSAPVPLGYGTVRCDHGLYPVPAPATLEMMRGLPVAPTEIRAELTTPTGAGIIASLASEFSSVIPPMVVQQIGYGAGNRDFPDRPNVLRAVIGEAETPPAKHHAHAHYRGHGHAHDHGHHHGHGHGHEHEQGHQHEHGHHRGHGHGHEHEQGHQHGHPHGHEPS